MKIAAFKMQLIHKMNCVNFRNNLLDFTLSGNI